MPLSGPTPLISSHWRPFALCPFWSRVVLLRVLMGIFCAFSCLNGLVFGQKPAPKPPTKAPAAVPAAPRKTLNTRKNTGMRVRNKDGRGYIGIKGLAEFYGFPAWDVSGKSISMTRKSKEGATLRLQATVGEKRMVMGNLAFYFSYPPLSHPQEEAMISVHDVANVLDPVLRGWARRDPAVLRTVVLDPACGGVESGIISKEGQLEKDFTLALALRMKPLLEEEGYTVVMTRDEDAAVFVMERIRLANLLRSEAIYISLRAGQSSLPKAKGIETSTLPPANTPATNDPATMEVDKRYFPGNINDRESMALATTLHSAVLSSSKATDLGIKRNRDIELQGIEMPAAVCRLGLLSNEEECAKLFSEEYQSVLAKALVGGVGSYSKFLRMGLEERLDRNDKSPLKFGLPLATHLDSSAGVSGERVTIKLPIVAKANTNVNRGKMEIQLYMFERVNGNQIDLTIAPSPKIEWISVLPDWKAIDTEILQATYERPAMSSAEMARLGRRGYYGFVCRLVYDGVLLDEYAEPSNLNRGLDYFTPVFPRR